MDKRKQTRDRVRRCRLKKKQELSKSTPKNTTKKQHNSKKKSPKKKTSAASSTNIYESNTRLRVYDVVDNIPPFMVTLPSLATNYESNENGTPNDTSHYDDNENDTTIFFFFGNDKSPIIILDNSSYDKSNNVPDHHRDDQSKSNDESSTTSFHSVTHEESINLEDNIGNINDDEQSDPSFHSTKGFNESVDQYGDLDFGFVQDNLHNFEFSSSNHESSTTTRSNRNDNSVSACASLNPQLYELSTTTHSNIHDNSVSAFASRNPELSTTSNNNSNENNSHGVASMNPELSTTTPHQSRSFNHQYRLRSASRLATSSGESILSKKPHLKKASKPSDIDKDFGILIRDRGLSKDQRQSIIRQKRKDALGEMEKLREHQEQFALQMDSDRDFLPTHYEMLLNLLDNPAPPRPANEHIYEVEKTTCGNFVYFFMCTNCLQL